MQVSVMSGLPYIAHAGRRPRRARAFRRTSRRDWLWVVWPHSLLSSCVSQPENILPPPNVPLTPTEIFRLPYELYVDASPGQALYRALGMGHARSGAHKTRPATEGSTTGSYVRHGSVSGLAMVVAHALRVGMPVWERGGDAAQLGGEFVLGPGYVQLLIFTLPSY